MKRYAGERRRDGTMKVVVWDDVSFGMRYARYSKLDPRPDLAGLPPGTAFDWGRTNAGAEALAAAILVDCAGDGAARLHFEAFARAVVCKFGADRWKVDEQAVIEFVQHAGGRVSATPPPAGRSYHTTTKTEQQDQPQLAALAAWLAGGRHVGLGLAKRAAVRAG